jgi:hypothetical protein
MSRVSAFDLANPSEALKHARITSSSSLLTFIFSSLTKTSEMGHAAEMIETTAALLGAARP